MDKEPRHNHEGRVAYRCEIPVCAAIFFCVIFLLFFAGWPLKFFHYGEVASNLHHFMKYGADAARGLLPWRDVAVEYPPVGALWLWALAPFSGSFAVYKPVFAFAMTLWAFVGLVAVWRLSDEAESGPDGVWLTDRVRATLLYTAALICVGPIGVVSYDYIPMALAAWAVVAQRANRSDAAMALLALGFGAKAWPAIIAPIFVYEIYRKEGAARAARASACFLIVAALLFGIPFALAPEGFARSFAYHLERGIEIGSIYGATFLAAGWFGAEVVPLFSHGSWNVVSGAATGRVAEYSKYALAALLVISYVSAKTATALRATTTTVLAFIIGFKVGSPQFLCWLLPFIAAEGGSGAGRSRFYVFLAAGLLGQAIFPWHWEQLVFSNPGAVILLCVKWALLVAIFAGLLTSDRAGRISRKGQIG